MASLRFKGWVHHHLSFNEEYCRRSWGRPTPRSYFLYLFVLLKVALKNVQKGCAAWYTFKGVNQCGTWAVWILSKTHGHTCGMKLTFQISWATKTTRAATFFIAQACPLNKKHMQKRSYSLALWSQDCRSSKLDHAWNSKDCDAQCLLTESPRPRKNKKNNGQLGQLPSFLRIGICIAISWFRWRIGWTFLTTFQASCYWLHLQQYRFHTWPCLYHQFERMPTLEQLAGEYIKKPWGHWNTQPKLNFNYSAQLWIIWK